MKILHSVFGKTEIDVFGIAESTTFLFDQVFLNRWGQKQFTNREHKVVKFTSAKLTFSMRNATTVYWTRNFIQKEMLFWRL